MPGSRRARTTISTRSRWILLGSLAAGACARSAPPAPRTQAPGDEPELRVAVLVGAERVTIGAQGTVTAVHRGSPVFRLADGESVSVTPDGRALAVNASAAGRYEQLAFASLQRNRYVTVDGRPFRGAVEVLAGDGGLTVVNVVSLDMYVQGVVNAEMGTRARGERAALEAQAIVSRTYALANRGRYGNVGYDLRAGVEDQVYAGVERETEDGRRAVRETAGRVLTYRGELIAAFFHSTCGGSTADPEEVFRSVRSRPYLRPVSDRAGSGYYCDISPRFSWRVEWDASTLRDILRRTVPAVLGVEPESVRALRDVYVRRAGRSGRVTDLRVAVADGEIPVPGHAVRQVLQTPEGRLLGGSLIEVHTTSGADGVESVAVSGRGWGHGVGMCQWGAVGRARAGQSAAAILSAYFPGAELRRWY